MGALLLALLVSTYTVLCTSSSLQDTAINELLDISIDSSGEIVAQRTQENFVPLALSALQPSNRRTTTDAIGTLAELFTLLKQHPRLPPHSFILVNEESRAWLLDLILTTHADLREKLIWVRAHQQVHVGRLLTAKSTASLSRKLEFVRQQITPNGEAQVTIVVHDVPNAVQVASALRIRLGSKKVHLLKGPESFNVEVSLFSRARMVIGGASHLGSLLAFCPPGAVVIDTARNGKQVVEDLQLKYYAMELSGDVPADVASLISITQQGTITRKTGTKCPIGTFRDAEGACQLCPAGTYRKFGGDEGCEPCPAGMFAATPGSAVCQLCPPNTFASSFGSANCQQCPEGKAAPVFGQSECIADAAGKKGQLFNAQVAASPYYYYYTRTPTSTLTYMQARTTPTATATNTLPVTQTLTASQTLTPTSMYVKPQLNNDCVGTCTEFNVFNNTETAEPQEKPTNIAVAVLDISTILITITFTSDASSNTNPGGATLVKLGNVAILVTVRAVISGTTALSITGSANAIITTSSCAELEIIPDVDLDIGLKSQGPTTYNKRVGIYRDIEYAGNASCIVIIVKTSVLNHGGSSHHRDGVQRGEGRHRSVGAGCSSRFHRGFRNHLKSHCALDTSDSRSFRSRYRHFLPLATDPELVCNCPISCAADTTIGGIGTGRLVANACGTGTDACTCTTVNGVATSTVISGALVVDNGGTVVIHGRLGTLPVIVADSVSFIGTSTVISLPDIYVSELTGTTITLFKVTGDPIDSKPTRVLLRDNTPVDVSLTNGGMTFTLNIPVPPSPQIPSSPSPQPVAPTPPTPTPSPSGSNAGLAGLAALAVIPVLLIGLAIIWLKLSKPPADEEQIVGPWTKADEPVYYKDDYYGHVAPAPTPTWEYFQEGEAPRGALYGESDAESVLSYKFEDVRAPPSTVAASPFLPAVYAGYPEVSVQIPSPPTPGTPSEISDYPAAPLVQEPWFPQPPSDSSMSTPIDTGNTSEPVPTGLWPGY